MGGSGGARGKQRDATTARGDSASRAQSKHESKSAAKKLTTAPRKLASASKAKAPRITLMASFKSEGTISGFWATQQSQ